MPYAFIQIVGLEKPSDLRHARAALTASDPQLTCWLDPLDQVAWLERPDAPFTDAEIAQAVGRLNRAGFWALPLPDAARLGPACIARHRRRRRRQIRRRLFAALALGLPVLLIQLLAHHLLDEGAGAVLLLWLTLALSAGAVAASAAGWFHLGLRSLARGKWRWRTGSAAVLLGCMGLAAIDLLARTFGHAGLMEQLIGPAPANPLRSLFGPAVVVLLLLLVRASLIRWRIADISRPFDRWLANLPPEGEQLLRRFLLIQAHHQRRGLDLSWGRLADRFSDVGLLLTAVLFVAVWLLSGQGVTAWLMAAGLLLVLDPRWFQFTWVAPEVLAERQGAAVGIFFSNPRVFRTAAKATVAVFEKTGTVTAERAEVAAVEVNPLAALDLGEDQLVRLAASVERDQSHPVARALLAEAEKRRLTLADVQEATPAGGLGVAGRIDGRLVRVGSERYLAGAGLDPAELGQALARLKRTGLSVIAVAVDGHLAGAIGVEEVLHAGAERAVAQLHEDGLAVRLLTGDSGEASASLAANLGMDHVAVELSPAAKLEQVRRWQAAGDRIVMVGRPEKDGPLLDEADVSIAVCDAEADPNDQLRRSAVGDIHVLGDRVELAPTALHLARGVRRQRRGGQRLMTALAAAAALVAVVMPGIGVVAEWSPAVVAAIVMAGLPRILGPAVVRTDDAPRP